MTKSELKAKIAEVEESLEESKGNKTIPKSHFEKLEKRLDELKSKLAEMERQEADEEEVRKKEQEEAAAKAEEEAAKKAKQEEEERKKAEKLKNKPKKAVKITAENTKDCREFLEKSGMRVVAARSSMPKVKRKVSTVIADNLFKTISGAVNREMTEEKLKKVNVKALEQAKKHGIEFLKSIREALGGIANDNQELIKRFTKNMDELIDKVKSKQEEMKQAA